MHKNILRLDPSIVAKSINMVNLSPKIQKMIVEADTPKAINREKLFFAIPEDWEEQERVLLECRRFFHFFQITY